MRLTLELWSAMGKSVNMRRGLLFLSLVAMLWTTAQPLAAKNNDPKIKQAVTRALDWLAAEQKPQGYWEAQGGQYRVAMTALSGNALLCEGSTTTRGKYAKHIRNAVSYLLEMSRPNGLIGPSRRSVRISRVT